MPTLSWLRGIILPALVAVVALGGCGGSGVCTYNGASYGVGASFPSSDGCNTCSCGADGAIACTELACVTPQCSYGGKSYSAGQSFPSVDGCNSCACSADGTVACTLKACANQCSYGGSTYSPGDTFPSTDGCNTCSCGQAGSVVCTKKACVAAVWLSLQPVQCKANPWEKVTPRGDGTEPSYPVTELLTIDRFLRDQGVKVLELGLSDTQLIATCDACNCARGDRLLVRASSTDVGALTKLGFAAYTDAVTVQTQPKQCNANPWKPGLTPADEARNVVAWANALPAPVAEAGFTYPTTTPVTCQACTCPRGDRLVTRAKTDAARDALLKQGFSALP